MIDDEKEKPPSLFKGFWKDFGRSIIDDQKFALKAGLFGAFIGGTLGAAAGIYGYQHFGLIGVAVGFVVGAVAGFVALWLMALLA